MNKSRYVLTIFLFLSVIPLFAQYEEFNKLVNLAHQQAIDGGFTLIEEVSENISYETGLAITDGAHDFTPGEYFIVTVVHDCYGCQIEILIKSADNIARSEKPAVAYTSKGVGVFTYRWQQIDPVLAKIVIFKEGSSKKYAYSKMFRKSL